MSHQKFELKSYNLISKENVMKNFTDDELIELHKMPSSISNLIEHKITEENSKNNNESNCKIF